MTPAQDPNQPLGKILRLTLDGKPAPGNPDGRQDGAATVPVIDPPSDTEAAKTAPVVRTYTFPGPNLTPAETWASGHRTPYGLAFAPDGRLWELEHGPRGGDELNLIEPGKNYGWPLVSYGVNYNGVPIPSPDTRPDLTKPVIYWTRSSHPATSCSTRAPCSRSGTGRPLPAAWPRRRSSASPSTAREARSGRALGRGLPGPRRGGRSRWSAMDDRGRESGRSVPRDAAQRDASFAQSDTMQ
jgi:glucose/arabinose dehydrogenase